MSKRKIELPATDVLSKEAIQAYVHSRVKNNIVTLGAAVGGVGVVMLSSAWLWSTLGVSSLLAWPALVGYCAIGIGLVSLGLDVFVRKDRYMQEYISEQNRILHARAGQMEGYLNEQFNTHSMRNASRQIRKLREFKDGFEETLRAKFSESSSTFQRYDAIVESLYVGALQKLQVILAQSRAYKLIDSEEINGRVSELRQVNQTDDIKSQIESLEERLVDRSKTKGEVEALEADVESAISELSKLTLAVAEISDLSKESAFERISQQANQLAVEAKLFTNENLI